MPRAMENLGGGRPFDQQAFGGYYFRSSSPNSSSSASGSGQSHYQQVISPYESSTVAAAASAMFDPLNGLPGASSQDAVPTPGPSNSHSIAGPPATQPYHLHVPFPGYEPDLLSGSAMRRHNEEGIVGGISSDALSNFSASECKEFLTSEPGGAHAAALLAYTSYRTCQESHLHKHPDAGGWLVPETGSVLQSSALTTSVGVELSKSPPPTSSSSSVAPILAPTVDSADKSASAPAVRDDKDDALSNFQMDVPGVSLDPMTGTQIIETINIRMDEVVTRYLPCVDFLVQCQQDLRSGLALATKKKLIGRVYRDAMNPSQFYQRCLAQLPDVFLKKNEPIMAPDKLRDSCSGIKSLCADAKGAEHSGCEAMKNAFLGGMRDGESWGLRRWLSRNGGALKICNDLELILHAMRKLERQCDPTRRLAELIRPRAQQAFDRLKNDVPHAYQEVSSAHPYLPFFHRLENALSGLAKFDPDDDDVIDLLDDDDEDVQEVDPPTKKSTNPWTTTGEESRKKSNACADVGTRGPNSARADAFVVPRAKFPSTARNGSRRCEEGEDSDIEVLCVRPARDEEDPNTPNKSAASGSDTLEGHEGLSTESNKDGELPQDEKAQSISKTGWRCSQCTYLNSADSEKCEMCDDDDDDENDTNSVCGIKRSLPAASTLSRPESKKRAGEDHDDDRLQKFLKVPQLCAAEIERQRAAEAEQIVDELESIAHTIDTRGPPAGVQDPVDYWNLEGRYSYCLRLFAQVLRRPSARQFLDPVDETELFMAGKTQYSSIIRNPLCFKDILEALRSQGGECYEGSPEQFTRKRGQLKIVALKQWNMFNGRDMLQAIDLVLLNSLAYNGKQKTLTRYETNKLRKVLWDGIKDRVGSRLNMPIKRGEKSGFVVVKGSPTAS